MKWLRWVGIGFAVLVLLVLGGVAWVVNTQSGTRWAAQTASGMLDGRLAIDRIEGTLAGPLILEGLRYRDPGAGIDLFARRVAVDLALSRLWRATVDVQDAAIDGVRLNLTPAAPKEPQPSQPFSLDAPVDLIVREFELSDASIAMESEPVLTIDRAQLAARWIGDALSVERLDVLSTQGEVHFAAEVTQREHFVGEGAGRFRWRQGDRLYAGTLSSNATDEHATVQLRLTSPMAATLQATVRQRDTLPWDMSLEVPRFDPREELMPGSGSMESLALFLKGSGTTERGELSGQVDINGETLLLDALRFTREAERIGLESVVRIAQGEGALRIDGDVRFDREPWYADVRAAWDPLTVPEVWAGQELATQGQLSFAGNPAEFSARGELELGPPQQQAQIALEIQGSTQALRIEQLDITQRTGQLSARGEVELSPSIGWKLQMQARHFDPGAFLEAWPGDLAFDLETSGTMGETAPSATLKLERLRGRLRQRSVSGNADLALNEQRVVSGTLALASGDSRIRFRGEPGQTMDAVLTLDIQSLTDWVPDSEGSMQAQVAVQGPWPELDIQAQVDANKVRVADIRVAAADVDVEAHDPTAISGTARVDLEDLSAAGLSLSTLAVRAEGNESQHTVTLTADGDPLGGDFRIEGGRTTGGWAGTIQQLTLDVTNVARLSLERPVRAEIDQGAARFSQACLRDEAIRLCAEGASEADGSLQASYSLQGVPLGLAKISAPPDLPLDFSGTINGAGDIRRAPDGQLHGSARISSAEGGVTATEYENETLLRYRDFELAAMLNGPQARATLRSSLNEGGSISGEIAANGLGEATTGVQGELAISMPNLATVALFVPQLANVQGRADVRARVGGTLDAPQLSGELTATELAAHVPELGLNLHDGRLRATPQANGDIVLDGQIASGDGNVQFDGRWQQQEQRLQVDLHGENFLAADIPAARVLVTPDLQLTRDPNRMTLNGKVTLPSASVDLQKLPRGGPQAQQASPDVVVVDEPVIASKSRDEATPLYAEVTVILGEDVQLSGFGLDATVDGRLTVRETPGETTTASGDIAVSGTYKAYGQDLTIEQGRLLYAGTPIDNPRLSIVAVRQIEEQEVTAGLRITGTARSPQLTVFSDPSMGQAEALAYLVTGRPLDSVGAEDGDRMQSAARSLGTAAGGLLAKRIGKRFGVDEVSVKESEVLEGAAFTVGEYLSPRLYLSYGVGLFEPGEVVTLRYSLSKGLALQALSGPEETRAGVVYRIEK